ncbi:60S ribosomal protein L26-1 [Spatholobus suberectus]|nr:60S ribosomal protein L26-1 [Spatholobus suberectus]
MTEVQVMRGTYKGQEGEVTQVYRHKWVIHIACITHDRVNDSIVNASIHPSDILFTKLTLNNDCRSLLNHEAKDYVTIDKEKATKFVPQDIIYNVN